MCALSSRRIVISRHVYGKKSSGRTCFIAFMFFHWFFLHCAREAKTFRHWSSTSRGRCASRMDGSRSPSQKERLMLLATEGKVDEQTVQMALPKSSGAVSSGMSAATSGPLADRVQLFEREVILAELKRSHHNMSLAAKSLGLERSHLYKKAEQLGIDLRAIRREQGASD